MKLSSLIFSTVLASAAFGQTVDMHTPWPMAVDKCDIQSMLSALPAEFNWRLMPILAPKGFVMGNYTISLNGSVMEGHSRLKEIEKNGIYSFHNVSFKDVPESEKDGVRRFYGIDVKMQTNFGNFVLVNAAEKTKMASLYIMEPAISYGQGDIPLICITAIMTAGYDANDFSVNGPFYPTSVAMVTDSGAPSPFIGINKELTTAMTVSASGISMAWH